MDRRNDLTFEERALSDVYQEFLMEMRQFGASAADGTVLDGLEGMILGKGRELLRRTLETQLQATVEEAEKRGSAPARNVAKRGETRDLVPSRW